MTEPLTAREAYEAALQAAAVAAGTSIADYTTLQSVDTLANYSYWRASYATGFPVVTYSFPVVTGAGDEPADYNGTGRSGTLRTFTAEQAASARLAFALWDDLIPISFVDAGTSASADTRLLNSTLINTAGGAPAGFGTDGDIWIYNFDQDPPNTRDWSVGEFYFGYWMLHEIGHTLGLSHAGGYPSTGFSGLNYLQDSAIYTLMSYNSESDTNVVWARDMATPMVNDIAAAQYYYGADMTTRTGDTVYGFNSTVTDRIMLNFDAMQASGGGVAPITIWDAGGTDTLDLSRFTANADMDLHAGGYTNANNQTMFIGIAYGAIIENAIGGRGNDIVHGSEYANTVRGGDGNDRIWGGPDTATVTVNQRDFVGIRMNDNPAAFTGANNQYLAATGITAFSGAQFSFEQMLSLIREPSGSIVFASYNVSGNDNQFILEGDGTLRVTIAGRTAYNTGVAVTTLMDGNPHRLSVTWDKASGAINLYIDGANIHSGTYTAAIGANISSGGTLVLGQEQDSPGGGFDATQVFQGVMGDIRIFNDVRTALEISNTAFVDLSGTEQGLVHNWQVTQTSSATIANAVSGGTALTVFNGATVFDTTPSIFAPDDDTLIGGRGNDQLFGGAGNDTLTGDGPGLIADPAIYGLTLNTGGVTSQSISRTGVTSLPTTAITLEFDLKFTALPVTQWFLDMPGVEVLIDASNQGMWFYVNSTWNYSQISNAVLGDGATHRISFTWDSSGVYAFYLDGVAVKTGNGFLTGQTLGTGTGTLSVDPRSGTIGDLRIYNRALTANEVLDTSAAPLPDPANTSGLVLNWQVGANGIVTDARGGVAPTINAGGVAAPTVNLLVAETTFDDLLDGGLGDDALSGGIGNDTIDGNDGSDVSEGGLGVDTVYGGQGNDVIYGNTASGAGAYVAGTLTGDGGDFLYGNDGNDTVYGNQGNDAAEGGLGGDTVYGGFGDDVLYGNTATGAGAYVAGTITGDGADFLYGNDGSDSIYGNQGNDYAEGGLGIDAVYGGFGDDVLYGNSANSSGPYVIGTITADGGDFIYGNDGNDAIYGNQGNDTAEGGLGIDTVYGGFGDDLIYGNTSTGAGAYVAGTVTADSGDFLYGNDGNDTIFGNQGDDYIDGGAGNDALFGGFGADTLFGGAGNDSLNGNDGFDTAQFTGNVSVYTVVNSGGGSWLITDIATLQQDTLTGIERVTFSDGFLLA